MPDQFEYQFEWDPAKAERNAKSHGVTFEQAATVFLDANLLSQLDDEHDEVEERWVSLGLDKSARLLLPLGRRSLDVYILHLALLAILVLRGGKRPLSHAWQGDAAILAILAICYLWVLARDRFPIKRRKRAEPI